ncbi:MAG: bifunctional phosphopantothenoylcysteine decarboxylase/phosphopantothenate--cysteine ligase CoaBC [Bacteroidia bacterium]|nr:bifunctional phosphopantothenoylcysteine decarboxylase/phosphopantothenate--cysteine ligase CoaBC [Bacteroidales bacterium]NCD41560.1 bifunctional phosphopantothenoylcysteine decarboxylase/phosphopantothenate--cysteine ligase CoaBC [Bacteroidia bacterium]MDD2322331.1 bifunctional phosphopantothenoylcysteine decarboxylase/phosphopantothenate--cysteine ligase CoaBC [Bacteroidales bacterium]MDD3009883.1 bifunctional phosphopantothenoylcysteine decarboxylase/phosphopantothenate--cysteine ligase C
MLSGKKVLLAVTGSIAAYKTAFFVRLLVSKGAEVQVIMTPSAKNFITPLTLSTLSRRPVIIEPFNPETGQWSNHVELGRWADVMVVAPASANTLAKMAAGIADNFVTTCFLAAKCPVFFAPAMDLDMFKHPAVQKNIQTLISFGNILISPGVGELASGLTGAGRMEEPEHMLQILLDFFHQKNDFSGKKVLVTAGPTYEPIDPVRFIGNYSSGKMGFHLASVLAAFGAEVTLVAGPTALVTPPQVKKQVNVKTAAEMAEACFRLAGECDIVIMAAAVADFSPVNPSVSKIKKSNKELSISLIKNTDILAELGKRKPDHQILVGFALETDNEKENAIRKLQNKNLDMIVLNSLNDTGAGFNTNTNKVNIILRNGAVYDYPLKDKLQVACDVAYRINELLHK